MRRISLPDLRKLGGERWRSGDPSAPVQLPAVPTFQELRPALEGELRRSRRYERPLAILVGVPDLDSLTRQNGNGSRGGNGNGAPGGHSAYAAPSPLGVHEFDGVVRPLFWAQLSYVVLAAVLTGTLRESDIVAYSPEFHEFVALLPECTDAAARQAANRLHTLYSGRMGIGLRVGSAVYPGDALTLDDLLAHARGALASVQSHSSTMANGNGNGGRHV